jgi:purine-binding chemotaxis protein CheW
MRRPCAKSSKCRHHPRAGRAAFANGLINVRGAIVPLADLAVAFGMSGADYGEDTRVIVIEAEVEAPPSSACWPTRCMTWPHGWRAHRRGPPVGMRWRADFIRGDCPAQWPIRHPPDLNLIFAEGLAAGQPRHISDAISERICHEYVSENEAGFGVCRRFAAQHLAVVGIRNMSKINDQSTDIATNWMPSIDRTTGTATRTARGRVDPCRNQR